MYTPFAFLNTSLLKGVHEIEFGPVMYIFVSPSNLIVKCICTDGVNPTLFLYSHLLQSYGTHVFGENTLHYCTQY